MKEVQEDQIKVVDEGVGGSSEVTNPKKSHTTLIVAAVIALVIASIYFS